MRPNIPLGSHPIETGRYVIGTEAIDNAYNLILNWVRLRLPGAMIKGPQRFGKTYATRYWQMLLSEDFPTLLCYVFRCKFQLFRNVSEEKFYFWLLDSIDHTFSQSGKVEQKRKRLLEYLFERLDESWQRRIIIFIDDAHRLHREHYEWLMDISNEIEAHNGKLTIILVGQPELEHQREVFIRAKQLQLIGRFMVQSAEFHGLRSASEMIYCLEKYDNMDSAQYPEGSGYSYTRFYLPEAFDAGWRLANIGALLWEAFEKATKPYRGTKSLEVPMQYFTSVVEYLLISYQDCDPETSITLETLVEAVINSGMADRESIDAQAEIYNEI